MVVMVSLPIEERNMYHLEDRGGDGGKGASVVFEVDEGLRTLLDFRYQRHFKAKRAKMGKVVICMVEVQTI